MGDHQRGHWSSPKLRPGKSYHLHACMQASSCYFLPLPLSVPRLLRTERWKGGQFSQAVGFAALNGIGLALVLPCVQSMLADIYSPQTRGRAFGTLLTLAAVGAPLSHPPDRASTINCCTLGSSQLESHGTCC